MVIISKCAITNAWEFFKYFKWKLVRDHWPQSNTMLIFFSQFTWAFPVLAIKMCSFVYYGERLLETVKSKSSNTFCLNETKNIMISAMKSQDEETNPKMSNNTFVKISHLYRSYLVSFVDLLSVSLLCLRGNWFVETKKLCTAFYLYLVCKT